MTTAKKLLAFIMAVCIIASMAACGGTSAPAATTAAPSADNSGDTPTEAAAKVDVPKFMTVGTGATGGAYYPIGVALADIMTKALGTQATAEVTGGSLDNLQLINKGECDIGIVQGNNMMDAYEGTGSYKDGKYENIAALFGGLSKGYFQVVVLENSSIKTRIGWMSYPTNTSLFLPVLDKNIHFPGESTDGVVVSMILGIEHHGNPSHTEQQHGTERLRAPCGFYYRNRGF